MKREYPEQPIMSVAGVVFDDRDRVLIVRRGREPSKGVWAIPGGALELGEKLHDAVKRELLEETNVQVEPLDLITLVERVVRDDEDRVVYHYIIGEYLCRAVNGIPKASDDVDRALYVPMDKLGEYTIPQITLDVIQMGWSMYQNKRNVRFSVQEAVDRW